MGKRRGYNANRRTGTSQLLHNNTRFSPITATYCTSP